MDANDFDVSRADARRAVQAIGGLDIALIAHGTLGEQQAAEKSVDLTLRELTTNGLSVVALSTLIAAAIRATAQRHARRRSHRLQAIAGGKATTCMAARKRWSARFSPACGSGSRSAACRSSPSSRASWTRR